MTNYLKIPIVLMIIGDIVGWEIVEHQHKMVEPIIYTNNNTIRLRTLCNGKLIEDTISGS